MPRLYQSEYTLPGAALGPESPLPAFRHPNPDRAMDLQASIPPDKRLLAGWQTGYRVLPYRMQEQYSRKRSQMTFQALVLENDQLQAVFLPEVGARLVSLVHLPSDRELLSRNPVFQPANLAIRNAWFSGGIEWNIGHYGHTFFTCSPVFAAETRGLDGEPGLRFYEYERCHGLFWQLDFYLPERSPVLVVYARVVNSFKEARPFYWWTNVAVPEKPGVRVLAPAPEVIYVDFTSGGQSYGYGELPHLPTLDKDASYATHFPYASEYFFQLDEADLPWEAALDESGAGFFDASTSRLRTRKMFCWGNHPGGKRWQQFLSLPGEDYLEIQAGMTPTQGHGLPIPAGETWDWLQVFGLFQGDPAQVHQTDYRAAIRYVDEALHRQYPPPMLEALLQGYRSLADAPAQALLRAASGWGALELARRQLDPQALPVPPAFDFPAQALGEEQQKWLALLQTGAFPAPDPASTPGEWMIQAEWETLLEQARSSNWFAWLHLGVMRMENLDLDGAVQAWRESIRLQPNLWAYRNLAVASKMKEDAPASLAWYDQARQLGIASGGLPPGLVEECLQALNAAGRFNEAMQLIQSLPENIRQGDRVQILYGRAALELGDLQAVEAVLGREYAVIREGETELTDLWADLCARREAERTGRPLEDYHRLDMLQKYPPPTAIDFRMF